MQWFGNSLLVEVFVVTGAVARLGRQFRFVVKFFDDPLLDHFSASCVHRMRNVSVEFCSTPGIMFDVV